MPRKLVELHPEDLRAIEDLAEDKSSSLQELMDEAVADLLKKHGRVTSLREALKKSVETSPRSSRPAQRKAKRK